MTDIAIFGAQSWHLAKLVPPRWHLGGAWGDPGAHGNTRKNTLVSRLRFLSILDGFLVPFWKFFDYSGQKKVFVFMFVSTSLFPTILGYESERPGH